MEAKEDAMHRPLGISRFLVTLGTLAGALVAAPGDAHAYRYSCGHMQDFETDCDPACCASRLYYTDNQIDLFDSEMRWGGNQRVRRFADANVWASDWEEDASPFVGEDYVYIDNADVYAFSSHGSAPTKDGKQVFSTTMCQRGASPECRARSSRMRLGEQPGQGYAYPHPGTTRFLLLATCRSVHTRPHEQWGDVLSLGLDLVMGYRFDTWDTLHTEDVLADLADEAFIETHYLKASWFWATQDFWVNDIASVVSSGTNRDNASRRRDRLRATSPRRTTSAVMINFAHAHHQG
jgi:hypothetical protein